MRTVQDLRNADQERRMRRLRKSIQQLHLQEEIGTRRLAFPAEAETERQPPGRIRMRSQRRMSTSNHDGR
jgi:hypothetical protein